MSHAVTLLKVAAVAVGECSMQYLSSQQTVVLHSTPWGSWAYFPQCACNNIELAVPGRLHNVWGMSPRALSQSCGIVLLRSLNAQFVVLSPPHSVTATVAKLLAHGSLWLLFVAVDEQGLHPQGALCQPICRPELDTTVSIMSGLAVSPVYCATNALLLPGTKLCV